METWKREFIEFMVRSEVLLFGEFVTKSGRPTPYFVNTGRYATGAQLRELGRFYARGLVSRLGEGFDVLFGPAYKGIPLVATTAIALSEMRERPVGFCFDRKEAKDHGEGGVLVGHPLAKGDRVVIVEDVTTAGTSVRETVPKLRAAADIRLAGLIVSVDRQERGRTQRSALDELSQEFDMPAFALVTIDEIVTHLLDHAVDGRIVLDAAAAERIASYRATYGVR